MSSATLKDEAEALAVALEVGGISVADATAWAEAVIARTERPHWAICEVATMTGAYEQDVAHALRSIPGDARPEWVRDEVARRLAQRLARDSDAAERIASALEQLARSDGFADDELLDVAYWAGDAFDLAEQGVLATPRGEIIVTMIEALDAAARRGR